ncbi:Uncharacterised protein [Candidatus Gugararchaeum adminiculabundum]|nr:Uncharacterised protein [Candidatus Gugararchaeum adminiculabundum]
MSRLVESSKRKGINPHHASLSPDEIDSIKSANLEVLKKYVKKFGCAPDGPVGWDAHIQSLKDEYAEALEQDPKKAKRATKYKNIPLLRSYSALRHLTGPYTEFVASCTSADGASDLKKKNSQFFIKWAKSLEVGKATKTAWDEFYRIERDGGNTSIRSANALCKLLDCPKWPDVFDRLEIPELRPSEVHSKFARRRYYETHNSDEKDSHTIAAAAEKAKLGRLTEMAEKEATNAINEFMGSDARKGSAKNMLTTKNIDPLAKVKGYSVKIC